MRRDRVGAASNHRERTLGMYFFDKRLQYPVRVDTPDLLFARQLQQAIGGIEGEIRVCMQYFFQAWGLAGPRLSTVICSSTQRRKKLGTLKCSLPQWQ